MTIKSKMRIGEFAEQAGVTPRTIRYYEGLGLLGPNEREGQGFRYYTEIELKRLQKIDTLKQLGLTLEEIGEVLSISPATVKREWSSAKLLLYKMLND